MSDPRPRRRFGQNFLVDRAAARRIVESLAARPGDAVVEIGPGRGALTEILLDAVGTLLAVEIDRDLARSLAARFGARLRLVEQDVLDTPFASLRGLLGAEGAPRLVLVGNLPYNISKPFASKLVHERAQVERAVLTFQREVAQRLTSGPGSADYGPLGILSREAFQIERLFDIAPSSFRPRPEVFSSVTRWLPRPEDALDGASERALRACLRACFAQRRRTLWNNLRAALGAEDEARALLAAADLDGALRAERVPAEGFRRLARVWPERLP